MLNLPNDLPIIGPAGYPEVRTLIVAGYSAGTVVLNLVM
jgi:hypothetical protein